MQLTAALVGLVLVFVVLRDAFETIVLPRRVAGRVRVSKIFYQVTWKPWAAIGRRMPPSERRESYLGTYGPISLLVLIALWGVILITGFALLLWAAGFNFESPIVALYVSGWTFTTLGIGDFAPKTDLARLITVAEAGMGFGFLAIVISYLPVLYQGFSRRETRISMLDEWAGSPPSAGDLLRRASAAGEIQELIPLMETWELWTAELLESHLSYQVLCYFRSQHENQSWVAALTAILDFSSVWQAAKAATGHTWQARRVYAMGRHALGDLSQVMRAAPQFDVPDRLSEPELAALIQALSEAGLAVDPDVFRDRLKKLRKGYEPYAVALAHELLMELPPWMPMKARQDNWETTAWEGAAPGESLH